MVRSSLIMLVVVILALAAIVMLQPFQHLQASTQGSTPCRTFRETGKTVCGKFLSFWQNNGALPLFGYPISEPFTETNQLNSKAYTVQYFERAVFELHPENKPPYDVLLSQLGMFRFNNIYSGTDPGEPSEDNLPLYPGAKNVQVTRIDISVPDQNVINVTTFEAVDSPEAVIKYYKEILTKNGWGLHEQREPSFIDYVYVPRRVGPVYGLTVEAKNVQSKTEVTLRLDKTLPK